MRSDLELQIENWEAKKKVYQQKEVMLKKRLSRMEIKRSDMDRLYAFSPVLDRYYKRLDSLYKQLYTLSAKINKCTSYLTTLKMAMSWS